MMDSRQRNPDPQRLLVVGVDGLLGGNLAMSLADRFDVLGLCRQRPLALDRCDTVPWDPADPAGVAGLIRRETPQWIVYCGPLGRAAWDPPQRSPDGKEEAAICRTLAHAAAGVDSRLTVISTDAVFAGPRMFHGERAATTNRQPLALAARHMEGALEGSAALVVRTCAYGWSPPGGEAGFAERIWEALSEGAACRVDPDRHATPILATDLAELLLAAYRRGLQGLYHVAGAERTSVYRFAGELAMVFRFQSQPTADDQPRQPPPHSAQLDETSLATGRARRELERPMPMLREGLDRFAQQATSGYRARLQSAPRAAVLQADAA